MDHQVKVRGERVELEDIAAALMKIDGCFACAVLIGDELHGVFERGTPDADAQTLRDAAGRYLPLHLIPRHFHFMPELPRNTNGKVDLAAIRQRIERQADPARAVAAEEPPNLGNRFTVVFAALGSMLAATMDLTCS